MDTAGRGIHRAFQPDVYAMEGREPSTRTPSFEKQLASTLTNRGFDAQRSRPFSPMKDLSSSCARLARQLGLGLVITWVAGASVASADAEKSGAARAQLTVRVTHLSNDKGRVAVALFASAADFPKQERALLGQLARISQRRASVTFRDLRPGTYAVAVLHDENENSKMDFNFLGMPLEGYGFSNDASAMFGPPSFEDAAFRLKARPSAVAIKARYFSL
jgi:uncharacterized protein (DUF2141 family)